LLRIFKLARTWKRFELLLETMAHTLTDVASFSILLFLYIFIFTLLGMELFAWRAKLDPDTNYVDLINGESPTFNFDNFLNSFSLVFIILTNDGTSLIYYNHYRSVSPVSSTIYFVSLVLIGQKIILNLFVAILLENFDEGVLRQKMHDYESK
jgi:voltage-dependent calcium channel L type alpha-1D